MGVFENALAGILFNWTAHVPELRQGTHLGHGSPIIGTESSLAWNIVDPGAEFSGAIDSGMIPDVARRGAIEPRGSQTGRGGIVGVTGVVPQEGVFAGLDIVQNPGSPFGSAVVPGGAGNPFGPGFDIRGVWNNRRFDDAIQGKGHGQVNRLCKGLDQECVHVGLPYGPFLGEPFWWPAKTSLPDFVLCQSDFGALIQLSQKWAELSWAVVRVYLANPNRADRRFVKTVWG